MSRIGRLPVTVPAGVKCELNGARLKVTGPKGALERSFSPQIGIEITADAITVTRSSDAPEHRALHGLTRALIQNMVTGVTQGFEKTLQIEGVGYRASKQGKNLNLSVGHSHPVSMEPPEGIEFFVDTPQTIRVCGIDNELVGQVAADIRRKRPPEPYKGKGLRYATERIRRKVSKAGAK